MPLYRNRLAALLAVFAMAMQGFWPSLTQAQAADNLLFGAICSVDGSRTVDLPGSQLPADGGTGKHQKHCALCVAGGDRVQVLAPASATFFAPLALAAEAPAAHPAPVLRSITASPAQPRAPPSQS